MVKRYFYQHAVVRIFSAILRVFFVSPILAQSSISIPSENFIKPSFLTFPRGIEMEYWTKVS